MEISITFCDNPAVEETLQIGELLGEGKFKVFEAYSETRNTDYAIKFFPSDTDGTEFYHKEKKFSSIKHPNIIERTPIECHDSDYHGQLIELARFGDFFDVVQDGYFKNNADLMRTYFHQLIKGVEYMHSQGVAHLDLKLENLMLGDNFLLKIIDFDSSEPLNAKTTISRGSRDYRAPELLNGNCKDFTAADIYAMGVILYIFQTGEFPYAEEQRGKSNPRSSIFKFIADKETFWTEKSLKYGGVFDQDFIELIDGMLERDAKKRFTMADVKNSRWFQGKVIGAQELKTIMKAKWNEIHKKN